MNNTLSLLTAFALILLGVTAWALVPPTPSKRLSGTLTGIVRDARGTPIPDASVEILKSSPRIGSYTRADGTFRVIRVVPGTYRLKVRAKGFAVSETVTVKILRDTETKCSVVLKPAPASAEKNSGGDGMVDEDRYTTMAYGAVGDGAVSTREMESTSRGRKSMALTSTALAPAAPPRTLSGSSATASGTDSRISDSTRKLVERAGQLTAGEWSDLIQWSYWGDIISESQWKKMIDHWGYDPAGRIPVRVVDGDQPAIDAEVRLLDPQGKIVWQARTNNRGWAELFAGVRSATEGLYRIEVKTPGGYRNAGTVTPGRGTPTIANIRGTASYRNELDLMFVIDATGSMGDELNYIKRELEDVIDRVRETSEDDLRVRLSCNFYRDHGDEYVVRPFPFNESSFEVIGQLRQQWAAGGGDTPEAVEEALEDAINKHAWSESARARIMFLVLDAPPHYTPDRLEKLQELTRQAAAKGIRIIPIASSGVDKETEFLLRLFSIYTEGTYLFLTDDSGIGDSHMKPTIGAYDVRYLNDLMVEVIGRYVAQVQSSSADGGPQQDLQ